MTITIEEAAAKELIDTLLKSSADECYSFDGLIGFRIVREVETGKVDLQIGELSAGFKEGVHVLRIEEYFRPTASIYVGTQSGSADIDRRKTGLINRLNDEIAILGELSSIEEQNSVYHPDQFAFIAGNYIYRIPKKDCTLDNGRIVPRAT